MIDEHDDYDPDTAPGGHDERMHDLAVEEWRANQFARDADQVWDRAHIDYGTPRDDLYPIATGRAVVTIGDGGHVVSISGRFIGGELSDLARAYDAFSSGPPVKVGPGAYWCSVDTDGNLAIGGRIHA